MNSKTALVILIAGLGLGFSSVGCNSLQSQKEPPDSNAAASPAASPASPTSNTATPNAATPNAINAKSASPSSSASPASKSSVQTNSPLTVEKLKNAEYYFLAKGPIKLVNGKYEDKQTKRTFTISDVVTYGDLNQDGVKDAATTLNVTIPNSGSFAYLVALVNDAGSPKNISSEFLGPGVTVKTLLIKPDKMIEVVMDQYQPGDPDCCPSLKITRSYKLKDISSTSSSQATPK
ncbi:MAG: hypothetical protein HC866_03905 [Leptolyngbyaceae cyanobacterium RU_5_1]|nr:hypothetical protein [Leptolyngbyaceae cyanobacterium RU_5_1]